MGTFVISMKAKRDPSGNGMYLSGTPTAVNAYGTFKAMRPVPSFSVSASSSVIVADSPLNAGHLTTLIDLPSSASGVWITSRGAVADGTTDNILALRDAESAARAASHKTIVVPEGDFAYSGVLSISGVTVTGAGPTSILRALDRTSRAIWVTGASAGVQNVQLLTDSASAVGSAYAQAGVVFDGAVNFTAYNLYIQQTPYVGIACRGSAASGTVLQNTISASFAPSIQVTQRARNVLVKLNRVDAAGDDGIQILSLQSDSSPVSAVEASYNWITNNQAARCMALVGGRDIAFRNNLIQTNNEGNGIYVAQESLTPTFGSNSVSVTFCTVENCGNHTAGAAAIEVAAAGNLAATPIDAASALAAASAGSTLDWRGRSYSGTFTVNKAITILGLQMAVGAGANGVVITSRDVTLDGFEITGPQFTVFNQDERGVYAVGSAGGRLGNINIRNCRITRFGNAGIETDFTSACTITNNIIQDTVYMGIIMCSGNQDACNNNTIQRIGVFGSTSQSMNAYGLTFSSNNPAVNPQPVDCTADRNLIEDVVTWHGLDTHAGVRTVFTNNVIRGCYRGIFVTGDGADRGNSACVVSANYLDTPATTNDRWSIQWVAGTNGVCRNNNSVGWPSGSAVLQVSCTGMNISGNTADANMLEPSAGAVVTTSGAANSDIIVRRCDINQTDDRWGVRYYGPQSDILFDSNRITTSGTTYFGGTTAGVTTVLYTTGNVGYPYTTAENTESNQGDANPPLSTLIDSLGAVWTVSGGIIYRNGVETISGNVTLLLYWDRRVYQQNSANNWWVWDDNISGWSAVSGDPRSLTTAPTFPTLSRHPSDFLQVGNPAIATYFVEDNRWGQGSIPSASYSQAVERALTAGPLGQVAFRTTWSWPFSVGGQTVDGNPSFNEVKAFPCMIYGARPGYRSTGRYPAFEKAVRLPDGVTVTSPPADCPSGISPNWVAAGGSVSTQAPSGHTNSNLPKQMLITAGSLVVTGRFSASATGKSHVTLDVWLQAPGQPSQVQGFLNSPITHEIMVPLKNFGGYGAHGNRNPAWYDHDVTIDGVLYHVYCVKNWSRNDVTGNHDGGTYTGLRYNFSSLNGAYTNEETGSGRVGWKFIVFQHDGTAHPLLADGSFRINVGAMLNYCRTRLDSRGIAWVQSAQHCVSVEIGVEPVMGTGELTLWDYRIV